MESQLIIGLPYQSWLDMDISFPWEEVESNHTPAEWLFFGPSAGEIAHYHAIEKAAIRTWAPSFSSQPHTYRKICTLHPQSLNLLRTNPRNLGEAYRLRHTGAILKGVCKGSGFGL